MKVPPSQLRDPFNARMRIPDGADATGRRNGACMVAWRFKLALASVGRIPRCALENLFLHLPAVGCPKSTTKDRRRSRDRSRPASNVSCRRDRRAFRITGSPSVGGVGPFRCGARPTATWFPARTIRKFHTRVDRRECIDSASAARCPAGQRNAWSPAPNPITTARRAERRS